MSSKIWSKQHTKSQHPTITTAITITITIGDNILKLLFVVMPSLSPHQLLSLHVFFFSIFDRNEKKYRTVYPFHISTARSRTMDLSFNVLEDCEQMWHHSVPQCMCGGPAVTFDKIRFLWWTPDILLIWENIWGTRQRS